MPDGLRRREDTVRGEGFDGWRLDRYLAEHLGLCSRSQLPSRLVSVRVNEAPAKLSRRLRQGDVIEVEYTDPPRIDLVPQDIPLRVLYEDESVVVVDKPQGMVVHPGCGHHDKTLVNALLYHFHELGSAFGDADPRPGIVHRLDKDTSGVLIVAKSPEAHEMLAAQFKLRQVRKVYLAVLDGALPGSRGVVRTGITRDPRNRKRFVTSATAGKPAVTHYRELRRMGARSFVALAPRTGRTHQLRVHMRHLGCPIAGDALYGRGRSASGQEGAPQLMLHAYRLRLRLPASPEGEIARFTAPIPERFTRLLQARLAEGREPTAGGPG